MDLNVLWFVLICVLFCGFFFLEGFDYGVCILMPFLGKNDTDRRILINTISPVWDGNEVWLLTAGGAMFAAFPNWYATMFSGFYLPLFLILIALIFRGVAFEFRNKLENKIWKKTWDTALFLGSLIPGLLFGVAFSNLLKGIPIDAHMEYTGGFFNLLSVYTLLAGVTGLVFFLYHGAVFISLRTKGELMEKSQKLSQKLGLGSIVLLLLLGVMSYTETELFTKGFAVVLIVLSSVALIVSILFTFMGKNGKAMITNGLVVIAAVSALFAGLFPTVIISSINTSYNLTITNASSSPYTLKIMTIIALTLVPIVFLYQGWTYWVFRKRVTSKDLEY
jgi:cytochrome bd ubiquinol oxidase subunit II